MTTAARRASGQAPTADSAYHPLTLPVGPMLDCRAVDSAHATTLTFRLAGAPTTPERSITATFDSSGRALSLIDWFTETSPSRTVLLDAVAVRFAGDESAVGFYAHDTAASTMRPGDPTAAGRRLLTPDEEARARRLTRWLWSHRCMRRPALR